jgi:hypothetical protein
MQQRPSFVSSQKRKLIFYVNNFQKLILIPAVVSFILGCFVAWLSVTYYLVPESEIINPQFRSFHSLIPYLLIFTSALMLLLFLWTYYLSNKLVGPYERIVRELDDVISDKKRSPIVTRKGDAMFENLLKRINILIKKLSTHR